MPLYNSHFTKISGTEVFVRRLQKLNAAGEEVKTAEEEVFEDAQLAKTDALMASSSREDGI